MHDNLDEHGQPVNRRFNKERLEGRSIDELVGIGKGIIADNVVNQDEATFILRWMQANDEYLDRWPCNRLYDRIRQMMADKVLDDIERKELFEIMKESFGGISLEEIATNQSALPVNKPYPELYFAEKTYVFTGKFIYGTRWDCQKAVVSRSAWVESRVTKRTDYLIIGTLASTDWAHSSHGKKIEKAMKYRQLFGKPIIVSEEHWKDFVS
ncbi:MAG: BRCT domain-containing protein [Nitrospinota bacterium]|nr:BRCT domain-containing protein [Nitrospinota bacterium]